MGAIAQNYPCIYLIFSPFFYLVRAGSEYLGGNAYSLSLSTCRVQA